VARFEHYEQCPRCVARGKDSRGDNCAVYSDGGKHCFSCGFHAFPKHYTPRVQEKERLNASVLPTDFTREVPTHALKWLLQYELPYSYWKPFIGWGEKDMRLVFPVGDGPSFSIGRYIPDEKLSSTGQPPYKWFVWGDCHRAPHILGDYQKDEGSCIVLVEDLISAHKVASSGFPSIALFGTKIFDACIPVLRHIGLQVVLWLDKDQEGTLAKKCQWLSVVTGLPVRYVTTTLDPKCLTQQTIKGILNED
jgi:hypothetical protein